MTNVSCYLRTDVRTYPTDTGGEFRNKTNMLKGSFFFWLAIVPSNQPSHLWFRGCQILFWWIPDKVSCFCFKKMAEGERSCFADVFASAEFMLAEEILWLYLVLLLVGTKREREREALKMRFARFFSFIKKAAHGKWSSHSLPSAPPTKTSLRVADLI